METRLPHPSILLVEDDPSQLAEYATKLEDLGYQVHQAASAEEGITLAKRNHIDVILSDNVLPGMTGAQSISKLSEWSPAPVFMMTDAWDTEFERDALLLGSWCCLKKPLDMVVLEQLLTRARDLA